MNLFFDVSDFHDKFRLPVSAGSQPPSSPNIRPPQIPSQTEMDYRLAFLFEEISELIKAYGQEDLAGMADALADIVWVTLGTAHYCGIPFNEVWDEVRRSNMAKRPWQEGDRLKPRNTSGLEIVKPEGWTPPDIKKVIREFQETFGFRKRHKTPPFEFSCRNPDNPQCSDPECSVHGFGSEDQ